jgi:phenylacetate-CoA ligase
MTTADPSLLAWPHQVPAATLHCLADAHFIHGLELGPPQWWQQWQHERLTALRQWLEPLGWWQAWLANAGGPVAKSGPLAGLPVMRRADYRALVESHDAVAPQDHGGLHLQHSSGSTGVPVGFWRSELANRISANHYWADHQRQGRDLRARVATLTGTPGPHNGSHMTVPGDPWLHPGAQWGRNAPQFSMLEHAHWVCRQAPDYLATTPATLSSLLSLIQLQRLAAPRLQQVLTSSHTVEPALRERTRRVLGASIRDRYSCEELGPIAFQCPESDDYYHVAVANVAVEVVDDAWHPVPPGTPGNVLVSGLHQWASPALRYDLGDIATGHAHCPGCGATVPALSALLGRKYFLVNTPNGGLRHVRILAEHWLACAPVREHRVVRTGPHSFRAELVLDHPISTNEATALQAMLQRLIGTEFRFELQQLAAIPWPTGRKRQEFVGVLP